MTPDSTLAVTKTCPKDGVHLLHPKWKLLDHVIEEVDSVHLRMPWIHLEGTDTRSVVDGGVLIPTRRFPGRFNRSMQQFPRVYRLASGSRVSCEAGC